MARALDLGGLAVHFALGEAEVLVTATVVEHVDVVLDADHDQDPALTWTWRGTPLS